MCSRGLELRSAEREQWQGEHTTIGRKSEWIILGSLLAEVLSICFSKLRSNMLTAKYCRAATVSASPFGRTRQKKDEQHSLFVLKTLCHTLTDYRTIVDDFYKVVEFVEWLKEYHPEKIL